MQIIGDFYRITSIDDNSPFWDLELLKTIKSKTNPRQEFINVGYGMPLESAIKRIINFAIANKHDTLSLSEYLIQFKKEKECIMKKIE